MDGLEHKDERLAAAQDVDWRDKLAALRSEITDEPDDATAGAEAEPAAEGHG